MPIPLYKAQSDRGRLGLSSAPLPVIITLYAFSNRMSLSIIGEKLFPEELGQFSNVIKDPRRKVRFQA
jgi:hypothetical protein